MTVTEYYSNNLLDDTENNPRVKTRDIPLSTHTLSPYLSDKADCKRRELHVGWKLDNEKVNPETTPNFFALFGERRLTEILQVSNFYTLDRRFLAFPDRDLEQIGPHLRHKKDLETSEKELATHTNYPQSILTLTRLLINFGLVPSYAFENERIQEVYQIRLSTISELFGPNGLEFEKYIEDHFPNFHKDPQFWADLHKNDTISDYLRAEGIQPLNETQNRPLTRKKSLISTVAKLLRKNEPLISESLNAMNNHTNLFMADLGGNHDKQNSSLYTSARTRLITEALTKSYQELDRIREEFKKIINDLYGLTFIAPSVLELTEAEKKQDPETVQNLQKILTLQLEQMKSRDFVTDHPVETQVFLRREIEEHRMLFQSLIKEFSPLLYQTYLYRTQEHDIGGTDNTEKINLVIREFVISILDSSRTVITQILNNNHLKPMHKQFFMLLFFAKRANWQIKDVSDYLSGYKKVLENDEWIISHTGLQLQITDSEGKTFEIQFKDGVMYYNSLIGTARHADYKKRDIDQASDKLDTAKSFWARNYIKLKNQ